MARYRIRYRDDGDYGCPIFTCFVRAHDREEAELKFLDAPDGDGWEILSIERLKND